LQEPTVVEHYGAPLRVKASQTNIRLGCTCCQRKTPYIIRNKVLFNRFLKKLKIEEPMGMVHINKGSQRAVAFVEEILRL
jgi:hypothetical protein